jgi:multicomponent Na+:H+ antiporter subunit G
MIDTMIDMASWACLVIGSLMSVVGGIGVLRLPDFYSRLHAGGITDTMGAGFILVGLVLQAGVGLAAVKLLMVMYFMLVASPTSSHALAQAAMVHKLAPLLDEKEGASSNS